MKLYVNEWKKAQSGKFLLLLFVFGLIVSCLFGVVSKSVADSMDTGDWRTKRKKLLKNWKKYEMKPQMHPSGKPLTIPSPHKNIIWNTISTRRNYPATILSLQPKICLSFCKSS